jgi:trehalose synthase-fused probable maltokinase
MKEPEAGKADRALVEFLKTRRWFGEKGRGVRRATLRDATPIEWPGATRQFAVGRADVTTDAGRSTYQLFMPRAEGGEPRTDVDALDSPDFRRGLADAWMKGVSFEGDGVRWIIEPEGKVPLVVPPGAPIALSPTEQTNSSVILNREAILKLYRKLEPGVHPDVEVTRFLTVERQFVYVPVLIGTIRFEDQDGVTIAGMLQEYVQGATDGWSFVLEQLREHFKADAGDATPLEKESEQLGGVTRALHENLASGDAGSDFDLRPASAADIARWERSAGRTLAEAIAAIGRALRENKLPRAVVDEARAIQAAGARAAARVAELAEAVAGDAGGNTRTHGDLHLGQTLRSAAAQFLIIDFEGEPTRPLAERRARSSPLRDVAGMLRSFAYAAALGARPPDIGEKSAETREPMAESFAQWELSARVAFLRGYFSETEGRSGLLPRDRANAERLIALFELEKSFYELQYELDHRPDWVWIPMRGITRLLS